MTYIALVVLIVGIVLDTLPTHFAGQHPLGHALLIVGAVLLALGAILWFAVARRVNRAFKHHDDFFNR